MVNGATTEQYEQQLPAAPADDNTTAGGDNPTEADAAGNGEGDNLEMRRYVAEVSASAEAVDQLQREGRHMHLSDQPLQYALADA